MVSRSKTLCRILVRQRFLLSAGLSAAAGIILKSVVLIPVADPLFRYASLQRPGIYAAFVWSFAIFLFTTPFLMLFMCFSLLYIHFYEEEPAETLGTLPEYPKPQYRRKAERAMDREEALRHVKRAVPTHKFSSQRMSGLLVVREMRHSSP